MLDMTSFLHYDRAVQDGFQNVIKLTISTLCFSLCAEIYTVGLWQDKMDKKCFLGVDFSTCSNHHLFSIML